MKVKNDHRSKFSNLSNWKEEAWKKKYQGFNGIRTLDLRVTSVYFCKMVNSKMDYVESFSHCTIKHSYLQANIHGLSGLKV